MHKATSAGNSPVKFFKTSAIRTSVSIITLRSVKFSQKQQQSSKTPHSLWSSNSSPITTTRLWPILSWQPNCNQVAPYPTNSFCSLKTGFKILLDRQQGSRWHSSSNRRQCLETKTHWRSNCSWLSNELLSCRVSKTRTSTSWLPWAWV